MISFAVAMLGATAVLAWMDSHGLAERKDYGVVIAGWVVLLAILPFLTV